MSDVLCTNDVAAGIVPELPDNVSMLMKCRYPNLVISNGAISARLFLPDAQHGYYRGVRFDWAGILRDLTYRGHRLFSPWKPDQDLLHDPLCHDDITGPANEFSMHDPPGYDTANPGELFLKIGVGLLERPNVKPYRFFKEYRLVDSGKWTVQSGADRVAFHHEVLPSEAGRNYGYRYTKSLRLAEDAQMIIDHRLENIGAHPIDTDMYYHNFINVDGLPIGPEHRISASFPISFGEWSGPSLKIGTAGFHLARAPLPNESSMGELHGYSQDPDHHVLSFNHAPSNIGMTITGTLPLHCLRLFATSGAICPEPFVKIGALPGSVLSWSTTYTLFEM